MARQLIDRRSLHRDGRPYVSIIAGPKCNQSWNSNFNELGLLDTGFSGWIILPQRMKNQISPHLLVLQLAPYRSPRLIGFKENFRNKTIVQSESYNTIHIRLRTESMGQPIHYEEFSPDIVSFSDKDYAIIGSQYFMKYSLQLTVNYQKQFFSLEQL